MTSFTKLIDFSFKIFQGIASYLTIILTSRFLDIGDYSYLSVLGMILVSLCTVDLGFNTRIINHHLNNIHLQMDTNRETQSSVFLQVFKQHKKTLLKIFLLQVVAFALVYPFLEKTFKDNHTTSYFIVSIFTLFVMFLGARCSTYLIALGRARDLFKIQGLGSILQLSLIFLLVNSNLTLIYYIPILSLPNFLVIIPIFVYWKNTRKSSISDRKLFGVCKPLNEFLSMSVQISQILQFLQGFAIPLILAQLYDELLFASVITQYRICVALLSSVGTLALSEWSTIGQYEFNGILPLRNQKIRVVSQLLKKYIILIGLLAAVIPLGGTFFWDFLNSKMPHPPLISWFLWGVVLFFYKVFTVLAIVETRLGQYRTLLYLNLIQVLSCIVFFSLPFFQSASSYPLNIVFSYLVGTLGILILKK